MPNSGPSYSMQGSGLPISDPVSPRLFPSGACANLGFCAVLRAKRKCARAGRASGWWRVSPHVRYRRSRGRDLRCRWGGWRANYRVTDFTASPSLNPEPETGMQTEEASSTSVALTTPTHVVRRRMTAPVAGSLISLRRFSNSCGVIGSYSVAFTSTQREICRRGPRSENAT